ncbi:carboxymuconolactone decarboxylase family protein [Roseomonas elaeocarpi]|uniref:Carboxymuconolactone decarboxylase family protein n=1 Tax=Roseomonas elaeocarpi TaxID=907779 RepID=A0ABV6JPW7_9PROT
MRVRNLDPHEMSSVQARVAAAAAAGKRGLVPAPLRAWLHSPEMGDRAQRLGEFLRYDTSLSPYLSELAILVTARVWTSHYEWFVHKREGLKAGIEPDVVAAIAAGEVPDLADPTARIVYDYATMLHRDHVITAELHAAAQSALGEQGVVELVGLLGYYTLVAMTLNAFEIVLPEGEISDLAPRTSG